MSSEKLIFWFEELGESHNDIVGKKCANLGEMIKMGLPVSSVRRGRKKRCPATSRIWESSRTKA